MRRLETRDWRLQLETKIEDQRLKTRDQGRRGLAALLIVLACLGGCAAPRAGRAVVTDDPKLYGIREEDRVLWQYRLALRSMRAGRDEEAKARFDDAIRLMGGIIADSEQARRARGLWASESDKLFIGEPYERAMAYFYRGILYWKDGEADNARACFRSAEFVDSEAEGAEHRGDYALFDYLDGYATAMLGGDGSDAHARAEASYKAPLPAYDPGANLLVFADWGQGPRKIAGGERGEELRFAPVESRARRALLTALGKNVSLPPWDDLYWQARTRGGRLMDHVLGNKAIFQENAENVGDAAMVGSAISADRSRRKRREGESGEGSEDTAVALAAVGILGKAAAAATDPRADTRAWDNLPRYVGFGAIRLPPGEHSARIQFLDSEGHAIEGRTQYVLIQVPEPGGRPAIVYVSELTKKTG